MKETNNKYLISIVIPLFNKERTIADTLESIIKQDIKDTEIVIVNDGSSDNSLAIVTKLIQKYNEVNFTLINQENQGVSTARNKGILNAQGTYILLLDADDLLLPNALMQLKKQIALYPNKDIYIGAYIEQDTTVGTTRISQNQKEGPIANSLKALYKYEICPRSGNCIIRQILLKEAGLFSSYITLYEDMELFLKIMEKGSCFAFNEILLSYQRSDNGLSRKRTLISQEYAYYIKLKNEKNPILKSIKADHLFRRIIRRILIKDFKGSWKLIQHNPQLWYMLYHFTKRTIYKKQNHF